MKFFAWIKRVIENFVHPQLPYSHASAQIKDHVDDNDPRLQNSRIYGHCSMHVTKNGRVFPMGVINNQPVPGGASLKHLVHDVVRVNGDDLNKKVSMSLKGENCPDVFYTTSSGRVISVLNKDIVARLENGQAVLINTCESDEDAGVI